MSSNPSGMEDQDTLSGWMTSFVGLSSVFAAVGLLGQAHLGSSIRLLIMGSIVEAGRRLYQWLSVRLRFRTWLLIHVSIAFDFLTSVLIRILNLGTVRRRRPSIRVDRTLPRASNPYFALEHCIYPSRRRKRTYGAARAISRLPPRTRAASGPSRRGWTPRLMAMLRWANAAQPPIYIHMFTCNALFQYVPKYQAPQLFRWRGHWVEIQRSKDGETRRHPFGFFPAVSSIYVTCVLFVSFLIPF